MKTLSNLGLPALFLVLGGLIVVSLLLGGIGVGLGQIWAASNSPSCWEYDQSTNRYSQSNCQIRGTIVNDCLVIDRTFAVCSGLSSPNTDAQATPTFLGPPTREGCTLLQRIFSVCVRPSPTPCPEGYLGGPSGCITEAPKLTPTASVSPGPTQVFCPADAKLCPDGSGVGRTGPNCEFASCPTSTPVSISDNVLNPLAASSWPACSLQTIKWNKNAFSPSAAIGIRLLRNGQATSSIAWPTIIKNPNGTYSSSGGYLRNNGLFDWVVPCNLAVGGNYQVRVSDASTGKAFDSSQFSIMVKNNLVTIKSPVNGQLLSYGTDYSIRWSPPKFSQNVDIAIYNADLDYNGLGFVLKNLPADWVYVDREGFGGYTWGIDNSAILSQANDNGPTTIVGDNVWVIVSATDRSASTMIKVRVAR